MKSLIRFILLFCSLVPVWADNYSCQINGNANETVTIGSNDDFQFGTGTFTLAMWIKPASDGTNEIFEKRYNTIQAGTSRRVLIKLDDQNRPYALLDCSYPYYDYEIPSNYKIPANVWSFICFQRINTTTWYWYVNGNKVNEGTAGDGNLSLSDLDYAARSRFTGQIDELSFWSTALSEGQVQNIMYRDLDNDESGLVHYWKFDEESGDALYEEVAAENNGSIGDAVRVDNAAPRNIYGTSIPYGNYAPNWSFEDETGVSFSDKWEVEPDLGWGGYASGTNLAIADTVGFIGNKSLLLSAGGLVLPFCGFKYIASEYQYDKLVGNPVRFTAWVMSKNVDDVLSLRIKTTNSQISSSLTLVQNKWEKIQVDCDSLEVHQGAIRFGFVASLYGEIYIDCVSLELLKEPDCNQSVEFPNGNVIANWDMHWNGSAITGWQPLNNNGSYPFTKESTEKLFGKTSIRLQDVHGDDCGAEYVLRYNEERIAGVNQKDPAALLAGQKVLFSTYVKSDDSIGITIGMDNNTATTGDDIDSNYNLNADGWERIWIAGILDTGWHTPRFFVRFNNGAGGTYTKIWVDGAVCESALDSVPAVPKVGNVYVNARNVAYQSQAWDGTDDIVNGILLDEVGQPKYTSCIFKTENPSHRYVCGMWGELNNYFNEDGDSVPDAGGFPYYTSTFCKDPLARVQEKILPGKAFQDNPTRYDYYQEYDFNVTEITDPNGVVSKTCTDKFGFTVSSNVNNERLTIYFYDATGSVKQILLPGYSDYSRNIAFQDTLMEKFLYDRIGNRIAAEYPEMDDTDSSGENEIDIVNHPDVRNKYDRNGNIRFTRTASQIRNNPDSLVATEYRYDDFERNTAIYIIRDGVKDWDDLAPETTQTFGTATLEVCHHYDTDPDWDTAPWSGLTSTRKQLVEGKLEHIAGNLCATAYRDDSKMDADRFGFTFRSYDKWGRVKKLFQFLPDTKVPPVAVSYSYDYSGRLISRALNVAEDCITHYAYDVQGRLKEVSVGTDTVKTTSIFYWPDGTQKTKVFYGEDGQTELQKMEYRYGITGWLKSINDTSDVSRTSGGKVFAQYIDYIENGYGNAQYFDGTIARTGYKLLGTSPAFDHTYQYKYEYDPYYQLTTADYIPAGSVTGLGGDFDLYNLSYDFDGNLLSLRRHNDTSSVAYSYSYYNGTNKLKTVTDSISSTEMKYRYDGNGNMIIDSNKKMGDVLSLTPGMVYDYRDMPVKATITSGDYSAEISFTYDESGNRVAKIQETGE